uniref:uncharacterized protein n=1 Tax=Centroberyx gerrardi TaxID=166262 RepID=UPI003AAE7833
MAENGERSAERMEKRRKGEVKRKFSDFCMLLLALLQLTTLTSAQNNTSTSPNNTTNASSESPAALSYSTLPADITVAVGEPAVFRCGVSPASSELTLTLYGGHGNHSITCPGGAAEDIPQAVYGSCTEENGQLLAVWTIRGTSFSDNSTRVVCRRPGHPDAPVAFLHVYDDGNNFATLIGCAIGGFFGILLVFGLSYTMLRKSERLQRCFGGKEEDDDVITIVTKD